MPLTFNIDDAPRAVDITSNSGKYSVVGMDGNDFPALPTLQDDACNVMLSAEAILQGVTKTIFATSPDKVPESYVSYLKNRIREDLGFDQIPVALELKASRTRWEQRERNRDSAD